jgi:hypothetical protein
VEKAQIVYRGECCEPFGEQRPHEYSTPQPLILLICDWKTEIRRTTVSMFRVTRCARSRRLPHCAGIEFLTLHFACDGFVVHNERLQISLIENARELSVVVCKSEAVALGHPVVPVADGFVG